MFFYILLIIFLFTLYFYDDKILKILKFPKEYVKKKRLYIFIFNTINNGLF